ncbi:putative acyltransferase [Frankia casuarinae]|uniref:GCN5-related N-acetyltransferase n=1 Tax=Frankia casuarinae (strain DSM 45818 / CECT 9043 / HFP020203 / CcI3) TaxID=106370 RepID=Q2J718_FRACC|nr:MULTISPECIES: GNAT family N-acetyltransferase [Frankia]ABD12924.1 GCN5-related N-acetyltransferase [Frankia casuarinae]ETA03527.1 putative acyltransferase [Frankia sp. CcI6]EYT93522.1 putative acyltransferase [Frankia casuarinae]KEZ35679.1 putative acyltransferase [Frankia sp. CeD]KFB05216.1 putative acyltransferase [Frankia sp. Allo2]
MGLPLRSAPTRLLDDRDLPAVRELLARNPVADVFVASRVEAAGLDPWRLGAEMWGHTVDGRLVALCYSGANLWPVAAGPTSARLFAERARRQGRRCSSIVGVSSSVTAMWKHLEPTWGRAREVRADQPLLVIDRPPRVAPDPAVRPVRPDELDVILPACIAMFTEEIGVSPVLADGGALYRARVAEFVGQRRSFAHIADGRVLFKAEIGAVAGDVCQIQGVWVDPALRGRGLGAAGTASVVALARAAFAPRVSLYVNDFNHAARRVYDRVGFQRVGTFASILF